MVRSDVTRPRGVFRGAPRGAVRHERRAPSGDLAFWVEHYWIVEWELLEPFVAETLPHPSVHVVIAEGQSRIAGVATGRFTRTLEGVGGVFGVKFRPGAFRPILGRPVSSITDREIGVSDLFGPLAEEVLARHGDDARIAVTESRLRECLPPRDATVDEVNRILDLVLEDCELTRVEDLATRSGLGKRSLQRLFSDYVGVTPKWVIERYRLHEVLERAAHGAVIDWTAVALDLGYFDQAHFIRAFRKLVGRTPTEYLRGE